MLFRAVLVRQAFALQMLLPLLFLVSKAVTVLFVAWLLRVFLAVPIGRMLLCTAQRLLGVPSVGEIRKALFVVFRLCLPVRMGFLVRAVPCMPAVQPLVR